MIFRGACVTRRWAECSAHGALRVVRAIRPTPLARDVTVAVAR